MICSNSDDVNRAAESALVWASSSRNIFQRTALYPVSSNDGARAIATSTESRRRRLIKYPRHYQISSYRQMTPNCQRTNQAGAAELVPVLARSQDLISGRVHD